PGTVVGDENSSGVLFDELSIEQQRDLVQVTFSEADAWLRAWCTAKPDAPLTSLGEVIKHGLGKLLRLALQKVTGQGAKP
ncbi:hypothetical protein ACVBEH_31570, partial [Roseateles sp. GG27B]